MASRRFRRRARPVPRPRSATRTRRRISCRWVFLPSISPRRLTCRCSIRTTRTHALPTMLTPKAGNGVLGQDPAKPDLVVATNGGSDLIYLPNKDRKLAERTVKALLEQDYVSGLFVDDNLGRIPGTLPMSQLGLKG